MVLRMPHPRRRLRFRVHAGRMAVWFGVLLLAPFAQGQESGVFALRLPPDVLAFLEHRLDHVASSPEARWSADRLDANLAAVAERPQLDRAAFVRWEPFSSGGAWTVDTTMSWSLLDPTRARSESMRTSLIQNAWLQVRIAENDEVLRSALAVVAAWRSMQQRRWLDSLASLPVDRFDPSFLRREQLLAARPDIAFDEAMGIASLQRDGAEFHLEALELGEWTVFLEGAGAVWCPRGSVSVLLEQEAVTSAQARSVAEHAASTGATLTVGLTSTARLPFHPETSSLGGWLEVGAPSAWPVVSTLRLDADTTRLSVSLSIAPDASPQLPDPDLDVEVAVKRHDDALRMAEAQAARDAFAMERFQAAFPAITAQLLRTPTKVEDVEAALMAVDELAHAIDVELRRALACSLEDAARRASW